MLDLTLEFVHHLAVFSLVAVIAAEFALVVPGLTGARLRQVGALDGAYGGLAALIVVVGVSRVIWGDAGWEFYVFNWTFWVKMALFVAVGLLSIRPTLTILRWRSAAKGDPAFAVPADAVADIRKFYLAQFALLALIPIFAALMARGIGL
jgi:putative membrane protein